MSSAMPVPRVTPEDIEAAIASEHYFTAMEGVFGAAGRHSSIVAGVPTSSPLDLLTICVLVLKNGHTVTGEAFCQDPAKFDAAIGRSTARAVAVEKLWPMVVYAARSAPAPKQYQMSDVADCQMQYRLDGTWGVQFRMTDGAQHRVTLLDEVVCDARHRFFTEVQAAEKVKQFALEILNRDLAAGC